MPSLSASVRALCGLPSIQFGLVEPPPDGGCYVATSAHSSDHLPLHLSATQPGLDKFMESAWPALTKHFGEGVEVVLEVIDYPYANAQNELVGWIQVVGSIQDGLEKLDQFVDEWFLDHMAEVNHRFNFNIEIR